MYCLEVGSLHLTKEIIKDLRIEATIPKKEMPGLLLQIAKLGFFKIEHLDEGVRELSLQADVTVDQNKFPLTAMALKDHS